MRMLKLGLLIMACIFSINATTPLGEFGGASLSKVGKIHANNLEALYSDKIMIEFKNGEVIYFINDSQKSASMLAMFMKALDKDLYVRYWNGTSYLSLPADNIKSYELIWFQIVAP